MTPCPLGVPNDVVSTPRPLRLLVTAGPTHEPLDAVRYLANRSSGRMGEAIADAAVECGCDATLLLGPVRREIGPRWRSTPRFERTEDLRQLLRAQWPAHDCLVMAAAVADFTPAESGGTKRRRSEGMVSIRLEPTPDLLAEAAATRNPRQFVVGFALEPEEELERSAREKLRRKGVDAIIANPLETMDSASVRGVLHLADGARLAPPEAEAIDKRCFAAWLMETLLPIVRVRAGA